MPAVSRALRTAVVASAAAVALTPGLAYAGLGGDGTQYAQGGEDKDTITANVGVQFDMSKNGTGTGAGPITPVTNWAPPACWYAPKYTPEQAARTWMGYDRSPNHSGIDAVQWFRNRYIDGHPYTNFNVAMQGNGYWWDAYYDESRANDPSAEDCTKPPFWVDEGATPPAVKNAVTPKILAELAYAKLRIPQGKANTNPVGTLTVNLPTWIWLDQDRFHPISVRAYVKALGIEATTTATPVSLHIDPGTQDADTYPASGDCAIDPKGDIGTPYVKGDTGDPPCGVTYLRSTDATGPYALKATITWKISWTGTGQAKPVVLPNGTFGTPQNVTVHEIQTVNR
jgi:enoyl reductase